MSQLDLVEVAAARVAVDEPLEIRALQPGIERVLDFVRREEDSTETVDRDRVGQLEPVVFNRIPDLVGGEFG